MNEKELEPREPELDVGEYREASNRKSRRRNKVTTDLPTIEFDGYQVTPKHGGYSCPHKCGDVRYRQPIWKTEKGFRGHMMTCRKGTPAQEIKAERDAEIFAKMADFIESHDFLHQVGDVVHFVHEHVVLPTHKNGRRVRYEAKLAYSARSITVERLAAEHVGQFVPAYVGNGFIVRESELLASSVAAEKEAADRQSAHEEHLRFSAFCR